MQPMSAEYAEQFAKSNDDSGELMVNFYSRPVKLEAKSEQAGRPIYEERDYVEIRVPGQPRDVVDRAVKDEDKTRFPDKWKKYCENRDQDHKGTPIMEWQGVPRSRAMELRAVNIPTVEALSQVSDGNLDNLGPGARELRDKARRYISGETLESVMAERDALKEEIRELKKKRKPGRPRKNAA